MPDYISLIVFLRCRLQHATEDKDGWGSRNKGCPCVEQVHVPVKAVGCSPHVRGRSKGDKALIRTSNQANQWKHRCSTNQSTNAEQQLVRKSQAR